MKILFGLAFAVLSLSSVATAQIRVAGPHDETALALQCLLEHQRGDCGKRFVGIASIAAGQWLWWNSTSDSAFGTLLSSRYVGAEAVNAYTTKFLNGRVADVYDVKFRRQKVTFYIVPPGADGKIRYLHIRNGDSDDEKSEGGLRAFN